MVVVLDKNWRGREIVGTETLLVKKKLLVLLESEGEMNYVD